MPSNSILSSIFKRLPFFSTCASDDDQGVEELQDLAGEDKCILQHFDRHSYNNHRFRKFMNDPKKNSSLLMHKNMAESLLCMLYKGIHKIPRNLYVELVDLFKLELEKKCKLDINEDISVIDYYRNNKSKIDDILNELLPCNNEDHDLSTGNKRPN